jgi:Asp-tRNA(Asn)/Glu-tRNA(Gln) amidotransferase A subunit family amidase
MSRSMYLGAAYFDGDPDELLPAYQRMLEKFGLENLTGNPAMSVPLWWNDDGLPIGVHFLGRFGDEARLIRLAAQLEAAQPWVGRRPAVHAAGPLVIR